jgi:CRISPR-associated protein Cas1
MLILLTVRMEVAFWFSPKSQGPPVIKRTIEVSTEPVHIYTELDQLRLRRHDPQSGLLASVPCEDIGLLVVDNPRVTFSHAALARLMEFGAAVLVCGPNHLPAGMLLPLSSHSQVVWRLSEQIAVSKPVSKRLWKQLVVAKILAQAANIPAGDSARSRLVALAKSVKSGDAANVEAQAARVYWPAWLGGDPPFRRDPDGADPVNGMLNYGYAVLRAAIGRAVVAGGLHPALGLHHCNRGNAFCLADDLLEPFRPLVDRVVRRLQRQGQDAVDKTAKRALLELLTATVRVADQSGPLMVALHRMVASLVDCYQGTATRLLIPRWESEAR